MSVKVVQANPVSWIGGCWLQAERGIEGEIDLDPLAGLAGQESLDKSGKGARELNLGMQVLGDLAGNRCDAGHCLPCVGEEF